MEKLRNPKAKLAKALSISQQSLRRLVSRFSTESNSFRTQSSENVSIPFPPARSNSQSTFYLSFDEINYPDECRVSVQYEEVVEFEDFFDAQDEIISNEIEIGQRFVESNELSEFDSFNENSNDVANKNTIKENKTTQTEEPLNEKYKSMQECSTNSENFEFPTEKTIGEKNIQNWVEESEKINKKIKEKFKNSKPQIEKENSSNKEKDPTNFSREKIQNVMGKLKELTVGKNLEKWLESINAQADNVEQTRKIIISFIRRETLENTWEMKMLKKFKESSLPTQVGVTIGVTLASALVGYGSWMSYSRVIPRVAGNAYVTEVGIELFHQRQEPAYHLLEHHAENAQFLSSAWANQYILWKYI